jgi:triphosphoribosyl-dephospho-CoA synthetase
VARKLEHTCVIACRKLRTVCANSYTRELENRASVKGKNAAEERRFRQLEERMKKEEARRKAEVLLPLG